jgi:hypothetical protein
MLSYERRLRFDDLENITTMTMNHSDNKSNNNNNNNNIKRSESSKLDGGTQVSAKDYGNTRALFRLKRLELFIIQMSLLATAELVAWPPRQHQ